MKKTKMLVATAAIVLGIGTTVYAELPKNTNGSIMAGNQVFSMDYIKSHIDLINQRLMNNLEAMFFIDKEGNAQDMFTGDNISERDLILKAGNVLTNFDKDGNSTIYVAGEDNKYINTNVSEDTKVGNVVLSINYNDFTEFKGINLIQVKIKNITGINNAAYYTVSEGESDINSIIAINDTLTYLNSTETLKRITIYDKNKKAVMFGTFYFDIDNKSGIKEQSVELKSTESNFGEDMFLTGNLAGNIVNNGFVTVDKDKKWIYYSNSADKNKLYKKSVSGIEDYIICEDSAKYINVVGDWVYYSNYDDNGAMYKVRFDGTGRQRITKDMVSCINVVGESIYYINHSDGAKVYVINNKEKKALTTHSVKELSLAGKSIIYSNVSDGNKLYSLKLDNASEKPVKLSGISASCINAVSETNIYYVSSDGKLYNNKNNPETNHSIDVISNVPKNGNENNIISIKEKMSNFLVDEGGNIYYKSYVDGGKLYKSDIYGNGYKICNGTVDFINLINTDESNVDMSKGFVYYMKSNKLSRIALERDGASKSEAVKKPKLDGKVSKIQNFPKITVDNLENFNFPERISAIMNDGSIRELVVNWNKDKPIIKNGIYTYTGCILGYGNKVSLQIELGSKGVSTKDVEVRNLPGKSDYVKVYNLDKGDIVKVYKEENSKGILGKASEDGTVLIKGLDLKKDGGRLYVTLTKQDKCESEKLVVSYQAEAPVGFKIDAENNDIDGLNEGKYIGYLYDASIIDDENVEWNNPGDGKISESGKVCPIKFGITVKDGGVVKFENDVKFGEKIDANEGKDLAFRIVKASELESSNSDLSERVVISRGKISQYVAIDYKSGTILGTTKDMQYAYDTGDGMTPPTSIDQWKNCSDGSTSIMINSYMQVWIRTKDNGPTLSSKPRAYSLFQPPVLTGINDGEVYSKDKKPKPSWDSINKNIRAEVKLYDDNEDPREWENVSEISISNGQELEVDKKDKEDKYIFEIDKIYAVVLTETMTVNGRTGTGVTVVKFKVNNEMPSPIDIFIKEDKGDLNKNIDIYYKATPVCNKTSGTELEMILQRLELPKEILDLKNGWSEGRVNAARQYDLSNKWNMGMLGDNNSTNDDPFKFKDGFENSSKVQINEGQSINQEGLYKLTVRIKNKDTGVFVPNVKYFIVDRTESINIPIHTIDELGKDGGILANEGIYKEVTPFIEGNQKVNISAQIKTNDGEYVHMPLEEVKLDSDINNKYYKGSKIDINGTYTLKFTVINLLNGAVDEDKNTLIFNVKHDTDIGNLPNVNLKLVDNKFQLVSGDDNDITVVQFNVGIEWENIITADKTRFVLPDKYAEQMYVNKGISVRIPEMGGNPASQVKVIKLKEQLDKPKGLKVNLKSENIKDDKITVEITGSNLENYEYSVDGGDGWLDSSTIESVDAKKLIECGDILARKRAYVNNDVIYAPSEKIKMGIRSNDNIPSEVKFDIANGSLRGLSNAMEYSLDKGESWIGVWETDDVQLDLNKVSSDNDIFVRYKAHGIYMPSKPYVIDIKAANSIEGYSINKGQSIGTSKIIYCPEVGNRLKIVIGDKSEAIKVPLHKQIINGNYNGYDVIDYKSGKDINVLEAGRHVGLFEVDSKGQVIKFVDLVITKDDIRDISNAPSVSLEIVKGKFQLVAGGNYNINIMQYNVGSGWKSIKSDDNKRFILPDQYIKEMFNKKKISIRVPATSENPKSETKVIKLKSQGNKPTEIKIYLKSQNNNENKIGIVFKGGNLGKCEYSIDGGNHWINTNAVQDVDGKVLSKYKYILVRKKSYINNKIIYTPSESVKIPFKSNKNTPKEVSFTLSGNNLILKGVNGDMEYSLDKGNRWTKVPTNSKQLQLSVYKVNPTNNILVRYRAKGMYLPGTICTVDIKAPKTVTGYTFKPGKEIGSTKINYSPGKGNSLKIIIGDKINKIKVPINKQKIGSTYDKYVVYDYESGKDIIVNSGTGQHIGLCEVNSKGQIIKFLDKIVTDNYIRNK